MNKLKIGDRVEIHSYKHNGCIHRIWEEAVVLEIKDNILIIGNNKTLVTNADGRKWRTKEMAIRFFYLDQWFNITAQLKRDGIYYKGDIASPCVIDEGVIKYIDYDLDLRVFPNNSYRVLDKNEYQYHKSKMGYGEDIDKILHYELDYLINMVNKKEFPFCENVINKYSELYKDKINA